MPPTRQRVELLAIPPDAHDEAMTVIVLTHGGLFLTGPGDQDWFCGRCGRILAHGGQEHQITNVWVTCPKCEWLNGLDIDLGWAEYVVRSLTERQLSLERLREIARDASNPHLSDDEFAARTTDAGPAVAWLRKISVPTLIAILALLVAIYFGERQLSVAEQTLKATEPTTQQQAAPRQVTPADVARLARELHRLQQEIRLRPPPRSTRGGKSRGKRR